MVIANSVELFSVKPNCEGVRMQFLVINLVILLSIFFSTNLENSHSREIDRNSSRKVGDVFFGMGMTLAILKLFGKVSNSLHLLNNLARSGAKTHLESFTNLGEIWLKPGVVYDFSLFIQSLTSSDNISSSIL